ncbi:maleylpyruvate isomerase N-terminal domain-containing protein [uncultured Pseudokineococcus sp.]|uniref:maleylpyruvate isomerase N-terminal domain-containing protein n=1 Tax=uncultured Pseudokineococcus sp. TaxID=1642928 RepID=UPI002631AA60|nr:maleylpyruvate isomerase N-terminal domain-containing protein [uncultured Pseudokineococcus sp.]
MVLQVPVDVARPAFADSVSGLLAAVEGLDETALLGASRCHGWTRLDVVVHVLGGWQEVLGGLVSRTEEPPTVDAATYWLTFAAAAADEDPVAELMAQRRRTASYARPSSAVTHLRAVGAAVLRGAAVADDRHVFQGDILATGDFLATWAVEHAVHHLDLLVEEAPPSTALALARTTVEALAGGPLPTSDDVEAVLVGAGRRPVPEGWGEVGRRLPALG